MAAATEKAASQPAKTTVPPAAAPPLAAAPATTTKKVGRAAKIEADLKRWTMDIERAIEMAAANAEGLVTRSEAYQAVADWVHEHLDGGAKVADVVAAAAQKKADAVAARLKPAPKV